MHRLSELALARLCAPLSRQDEAEAARWLEQAEFDRGRLNEQVQAGSSLAYHRLKAVRIAPSSTLFLGKDSGLALSAWVAASDGVSRHVQAGAFPNWQLLLDLAATLGLERGLRVTAAQGGNCEYPPPGDLSLLLNEFESKVLARLGQDAAVLEASRLYQWLATLHFFQDGNGRLSRLAADWRLALDGFPPLGFPHDGAAFVSALDESAAYNGITALRRISAGIRNSVDALCSHDP